LSTRLKEKEEKILQILDAMAEESATGTPIVVEGRKDLETLRVLGIEGIILTAKTGGKSFLDVISEIEQTGAAEVILFLDFDRRGMEGTRLLKQYLERTRTKPNIKFWHELSALLGKEIQCVESLIAYMETLRKKIGDSI
jgi:5S rRNA maturation endonuclease (ribonuclease M5)